MADERSFGSVVDVGIVDVGAEVAGVDEALGVDVDTTWSAPVSSLLQAIGANIVSAISTPTPAPDHVRFPDDPLIMGSR